MTCADWIACNAMFACMKGAAWGLTCQDMQHAGAEAKKNRSGCVVLAMYIRPPTLELSCC
jgi:hypothetical protein